MASTGGALARACVGAALLLTLVHSTPAALPPSLESAPAPRAAGELRALWVLRSSLTSPERIAGLVHSAKRNGFNALFVQVRGRGDAYYKAHLEPRASELSRQPRHFDPLAELLKVSRAADLRVHAWVNVNLVSSATYLPTAPQHVVARHPEWLMVPRGIARELARVSPSNPEYVRRLASWTRKHSAEVEGLYVSPVHASAVTHLRSVVREIVRGYPVDGVHFDYVRYPNDDFDYSRAAVREFRKWIESAVPAARRRERGGRKEHDVFALPDALPDDWRRFRVSHVTRLVSQLRDVVKEERPAAVVSVAVAADAQEALNGRLQDWTRWLDEGIVDAVCPMAYTAENGKFVEQITAAVAAAGDRQVWAGIGSYRLSPAQTVANITAARRLGAGGIILFSYDSLTGSGKLSKDYLSLVSRAAFTRTAPHGSSR